jgi:hypothetical protein
MLALLAGFFMDNVMAAVRVTVWRSAFLALLAVLAARLTPFKVLSIALPDVLAAPLVLIGRVEVTAVQKLVESDAMLEIADPAGVGWFRRRSSTPAPIR